MPNATPCSALLDNQRFARGVEPDAEHLNAAMVRRLKSELPPRWDGSPRFPRREIMALAVAYTRQERDAYQLLQEYSQSRITESRDAIEHYATEFVAKLLKTRESIKAAFQADPADASVRILLATATHSAQNR